MKAKFLPIALLIMAVVINACSPFTVVRSSLQSAGPGPVMVVESPATGYQPVVIDDVQIEVGDGSPAPVHVRISGNLPDTCAQVEYMEIRQEGSDVVMKVSAIPG